MRNFLIILSVIMLLLSSCSMFTKDKALDIILDCHWLNNDEAVLAMRVTIPSDLRYEDMGWAIIRINQNTGEWEDVLPYTYFNETSQKFYDMYVANNYVYFRRYSGDLIKYRIDLSNNQIDSVYPDMDKYFRIYDNPPVYFYRINEYNGKEGRFYVWENYETGDSTVVETNDSYYNKLYAFDYNIIYFINPDFESANGSVFNITDSTWISLDNVFASIPNTLDIDYEMIKIKADTLVLGERFLKNQLKIYLNGTNPEYIYEEARDWFLNDEGEYINSKFGLSTFGTIIIYNNQDIPIDTFYLSY